MELKVSRQAQAATTQKMMTLTIMITITIMIIIIMGAIKRKGNFFNPSLQVLFSKTTGVLKAAIQANLFCLCSS